MDKSNKIERAINVYQIIDNKLITEIRIDDIDFDLLRKVVPPPFKDPLLYDDYPLTIEQVTALINKVDINTDVHYYKLVCVGLYVWLI
jgi:hypothetical protein